jgi:hypothetical protein
MFVPLPSCNRKCQKCYILYYLALVLVGDKAKPVLNLRVMFRCAGPRVSHVVLVDFKDPVIGDLLFVIGKAAPLPR